jgi:hypothetical protein
MSDQVVELIVSVLILAVGVAMVAISAMIRRNGGPPEHEGWESHAAELAAIRAATPQDLTEPAEQAWPVPVDGERWPEPATGRAPVPDAPLPGCAVYRSVHAKWDHVGDGDLSAAAGTLVVVTPQWNARRDDGDPDARHRADPPDDGTGQWAAEHPETAGINPWFAAHIAKATSPASGGRR